MKLYRYMKKKHLDNFLKTGALKIGTLFEYRNEEGYGTVIGDQNEGIRETTFNVPGGGTVDLNDNTREAAYLRHSFNVQNLGLPAGRPLPKIQFAEGAVIVRREISNDVFTMCMSSEYNAETMEKFNHDACLEIVEPQQFLKEVSRAIRHKGRFVVCGPIRYVDRRTNYRQLHDVHPSLIKDPEYQYQAEVRAIWSPLRATVEPIFVNVPRAVKYCRIYPA